MDGCITNQVILCIIPTVFVDPPSVNMFFAYMYWFATLSKHWIDPTHLEHYAIGHYYTPNKSWKCPQIYIAFIYEQHAEW